jgi:hypothetical protein
MRPVNLARLSPLRRAYLLGYRRGLNRAWATMRCKARAWEDQIAVLEADYEALINEMRCARDERAAQEALVERAMLTRLN